MIKSRSTSNTSTLFLISFGDFLFNAASNFAPYNNTRLLF